MRGDGCCLMLSRRSPRWVYWPAKLAWAPMFFVGLPLMLHFTPKADKIEGGWRILVSFTTPDQWVAHLATFIPGLLLTVAGIVLFFVYQYDPGPGRPATAIDYPLYSIAGWVFGLTAVMAGWRTSGHVAEVGGTGVDWRFLASLRVQPLDYVVMAVAAAACLACALASWGFVGGRWAAPAHTNNGQQDAQAQ